MLKVKSLFAIFALLAAATIGSAQSTATATSTATVTWTSTTTTTKTTISTATATWVSTTTATQTSTSTATWMSTTTSTKTSTATATWVSTSTTTSTSTAVATWVSTTTATQTSTATATWMSTTTSTKTSTATATWVSTTTATSTSTAITTWVSTTTATQTSTATATWVSTTTSTKTSTATATWVSTSTATSTSTAIATWVSTTTATQTSTATATWVSTTTSTKTAVSTTFWTSTSTVTSTATVVTTWVSTYTSTKTSTVTATATQTSTSTATSQPSTTTSTATSTTTTTSTPTSTVITNWEPLYTSGTQACPKAPIGFVKQHGQLKTNGGKIVDVLGQPVILRGISLFWSQWMGQFWNAGVVNKLVTDWHVTVVRAAMGVESGGYLTQATTEKNRVIAVIEAALAAGIYVVVDWHDHNADQHQGQAKTFFDEIAKTYGNCPHLIFETFNEPEWQDWSSVIKPYHQTLVTSIRAKSQNLVILGSRMWDQRLDEVAANPLDTSKYPNIAYTVHFYAATHKQWNRDMVQVAVNKNLPILASECGLSEASGNGNIDVTEFNTWVNYLESKSIGWIVWSLADKAESSAMLKPGASTSGAWSTSNYTPAGLATYNLLRSKQ